MPRYYWEQCYKLDDIHWALCDDESSKSELVTDHHLVLNATYPVCCDGRPLSEQPMPALIIALLNGEHGKALTEKAAEIETLRIQLKNIGKTWTGGRNGRSKRRFRDSGNHLTGYPDVRSCRCCEAEEHLADARTAAKWLLPLAGKLNTEYAVQRWTWLGTQEGK